jgi:hypothetical protein
MSPFQAGAQGRLGREPVSIASILCVPRSKGTAMRILHLTLAAVLAASAAAPAFAADRISDSELVRASRCLGLAKAANLGAVDATALQSFVKTQRKGPRPAGPRSRREPPRQAAKSQASKAKDDLKAT